MFRVLFWYVRVLELGVCIWIIDLIIDRFLGERGGWGVLKVISILH